MLIFLLCQHLILFLPTQGNQILSPCTCEVTKCLCLMQRGQPEVWSGQLGSYLWQCSLVTGRHRMVLG